MKDDSQKGTVHGEATVLVQEAGLPELIHESVSSARSAWFAVADFCEKLLGVKPHHSLASPMLFSRKR